MHEYVTKAVVLDKATRGGHADARYSFFTERFGKIAARATSSRKIVSKLAGHLEPGTVTAVRIIEQHGTKVVDALKLGRANISLRDLASLSSLLGEWEPDVDLWRELIAAANFSWANTLAILGWDPSGAVCAECGLDAASQRQNALHFYIPRQEFFCASCAASAFNFSRNFSGRASRFARNDLILIS
jgi:recombinational DNA repair protein (RecF pathway)